MMVVGRCVRMLKLAKVALEIGVYQVFLLLLLFL